MPRTDHTYVCAVDAHRRPSRQRSTAGRYLAGARSRKEAAELVRAAVKFGSVQVLYRATDENGRMPAGNKTDRKMPYGQVMRVGPGNILEPARAATDPLDG